MLNEKTKSFIFLIFSISLIYLPTILFNSSLIPNHFEKFQLGFVPKDLNKIKKEFEAKNKTADFQIYCQRNPDKCHYPSDRLNIELSTSAYYEYPIDKHRSNSIKNGEFPFWNKFQGIGMPTVANYSTRNFFPLQLISDLAGEKYWHFFIFVKALVGAIGLFIFLVMLGIKPAAAAFGGIIFGGGGNFAWFGSLQQMSNLAVWLPWLLIASEKIILKPKFTSAIILGFALYGIIVAGQPETLIICLILSYTYLLIRICQTKEHFRINIIWIFFGTFLGLSSSFLQWGPFIELWANGFTLHTTDTKLGLGTVPDLLRYLIFLPGLGDFFWPTTRGPANGLWDYAGTYVGLVGIVFFILSFTILDKTKRVFSLFFSIFFIILFLKNIGIRPFLWIGYIPLIDLAWTPRWSGPVVSITFAIACSFGLEKLVENNGKTLNSSNKFLDIFTNFSLIKNKLISKNIFNLKIQDFKFINDKNIFYSLFLGLPTFILACKHLFYWIEFKNSGTEFLLSFLLEIFLLMFLIKNSNLKNIIIKRVLNVLPFSILLTNFLVIFYFLARHPYYYLVFLFFSVLLLLFNSSFNSSRKSTITLKKSLVIASLMFPIFLFSIHFIIFLNPNNLITILKHLFLLGLIIINILFLFKNFKQFTNIENNFLKYKNFLRRKNLSFLFFGSLCFVILFFSFLQIDIFWENSLNITSTHGTKFPVNVLDEVFKNGLSQFSDWKLRNYSIIIIFPFIFFCYTLSKKYKTSFCSSVLILTTAEFVYWIPMGFGENATIYRVLILFLGFTWALLSVTKMNIIPKLFYIFFPLSIILNFSNQLNKLPNAGKLIQDPTFLNPIRSLTQDGQSRVISSKSLPGNYGSYFGVRDLNMISSVAPRNWQTFINECLLNHQPLGGFELWFPNDLLIADREKRTGLNDEVMKTRFFNLLNDRIDTLGLLGVKYILFPTNYISQLKTNKNLDIKTRINEFVPITAKIFTEDQFKPKKAFLLKPDSASGKYFKDMKLENLLDENEKTIYHSIIELGSEKKIKFNFKKRTKFNSIILRLNGSDAHRFLSNDENINLLFDEDIPKNDKNLHKLTLSGFGYSQLIKNNQGSFYVVFEIPEVNIKSFSFKGPTKLPLKLSEIYVASFPKMKRNLFMEGMPGINEYENYASKTINLKNNLDLFKNYKIENVTNNTFSFDNKYENNFNGYIGFEVYDNSFINFSKNYKLEYFDKTSGWTEMSITSFDPNKFLYNQLSYKTWIDEKKIKPTKKLIFFEKKYFMNNKTYRISGGNYLDVYFVPTKEFNNLNKLYEKDFKSNFCNLDNRFNQNKNLEKLEKVFSDKSYTILKNPMATNRAYIVNNFELAKNSKDAIEKIKFNKVDRSKIPVIELLNQLSIHIPEKIIKPNNLKNDKVKIVLDKNNEVLIKANLTKKGLLVLSDLYYPGWKAYVNDNEQPISRVNTIVRGVFLNKGENKVHFKYNFWYLDFSIISTFLLLMFGIIMNHIIVKNRIK